MKIIAVGKLRESYWQEGVSDYARRLRPYTRVEIIEIPEARIPEGASHADEAKAMGHEGDAIIAKLKMHEGPVIALDRQGKALNSLKLAEWTQKQILDGQKGIAWIIGGPLGLTPSVTMRADLVLSFSRLTFPHQMVRLMLMEQIYRSFRIIRHEPYHK